MNANSSTTPPPRGSLRAPGSILTMSDEPIYSIGALARMLGVSPATLRSWEDRYGAGRARAQRRVAARCTPAITSTSFCSSASRCSSGLSAADAHRALAERLADDPRARRRATATNRANAESCSSSAIRTRPSSPSTSCAPRATTCTSSRRSPTPSTSSASERIDLAIVDLMIGGGAGLALCASDLAGTIPVLAVSALDQNDRALAGGCAGVHAQALRLADARIGRARPDRDERDRSRRTSRALAG